MNSIKVILNPVAGRGFAAKSEPDIIRYMKELELNFDLVRTERSGHAIELAEQAVYDGFDIVVAVGGDGTNNEVVNGLMNAASKGKEAVMGTFSAGSGSDFTYNVGAPKDLKEACLKIKEGRTRRVDIGKFKTDKHPERYFDNQFGIGFDGTVTLVAKRYKKLRGIALYVPVVFQTIFVDSKPSRVKIKTENEELNLSALQISIANGNREGGSFFMAPDAKLDDGLFDICVVEELSRPKIMGMVPKFMAGTHINHPKTKMLKTKEVSITSEDNLIAHFDGELLENIHEINCEIIPRCLSVIY